MPAPKEFPDMWAEVKAALAQLRQFMRNPLANTGMSVPGPGVVQVDGTLNVAGPLNVTGDTAIEGTLSLPAGIIDNDALANPVVPGAANDTGSGFAVTTTFAEQAFKVLTVPAGFTTLSIMASGWVFAYNPNTSGGVDGTGTDALWCFVRVGGPSDTDSEERGQGISGSGGFTTATSGIATVKSGLTPGDTVRVGVYAGSSIAGFAANAGNNATLSALLTWLR